MGLPSANCPGSLESVSEAFIGISEPWRYLDTQRLAMIITFPKIFSVDELRAGNRIRQIGQQSLQAEGMLVPFIRGGLHGLLFQPIGNGEEVLVVPKTKRLPCNHPRIIQATVATTGGSVDLSNVEWLRHPLLRGVRSGTIDHATEIRQVLESWSGAFAYVQEDPARAIKGLRCPQIGALHAIRAHWTVTTAPATIVMPTGTGKTETMLSVLVSVGCPKLLVVVPTDALRTQLAEKFLTLGILKEPDCPVLNPLARHPIVGVLEHIPRNVGEVDDVFGHCQVIITTSSIAGKCNDAVQYRMAQLCPYLFIDEAHHAEAPTWSAFKERFREMRILQFTATPFREDGKPLDGDIIYKYPLKKAQQEGYFGSIRFIPVMEFNPARSDKAIAERAIKQLRTDAQKRHIVMARVDSIERAKEVFEIYSQYPEFKPVQLHTGIKSPRLRNTIRHQIITGESRIVVCVDMLGEGFDLPELKIAAFHDIRKTLPVTLQLAGRFTRARSDLGNATFIANIASLNVQEELRKLYTRDPDWNALIPELSDKVIGKQVSLQEFLRGFTEFAKEIPLKTVRPATSAVVYRTTCANWAPENFRVGIPRLAACEQVHDALNHAKHTLVVVTVRRVPLSWTEVESLFSWEWELYVLIWSPEQNLLFVNSSTNSGDFKALAEAVAGSDVRLIKGQDVFKTFAGVNRLRLQNVGLTEQLGRNVRYTGRMGSDVEQALTDLQRRRARKSVLSGTGYENGQKVTVGASRKGRIWAFRRERLDRLAAWCREIGAKLLDDRINPDEVLKGTLDAKAVTERPPKMPIAIDWPEEIYTAPESMWWIMFGERAWPLTELSIELSSPSLIGPLGFAIESETDRVELNLEMLENDEGPNYRFLVKGERPVKVRRGETAEAVNIIDFLYNAPPVIWFVDGSSLEGNQYVELRSQYPSYKAAKIEAWDWTGIDLRKESQGECKDPTSIQARVIKELKSRGYTIIFDDDRKGEAADIVAIRLTGDSATPSIEVEFYHCKYSLESTPGQRIKDLYEVCGQAQKSISWISSPERQTDIFTHLLRREALRREAGGASRFEFGNQDLLLTIREMSIMQPVSLRIYIVQPGVSKANATRDQLELMGVTENHLMETYQIPFGVIASP